MQTVCHRSNLKIWHKINQAVYNQAFFPKNPLFQSFIFSSTYWMEPVLRRPCSLNATQVQVNFDITLLTTQYNTVCLWTQSQHSPAHSFTHVYMPWHFAQGFVRVFLFASWIPLLQVTGYPLTSGQSSPSQACSPDHLGSCTPSSRMPIYSWMDESHLGLAGFCPKFLQLMGLTGRVRSTLDPQDDSTPTSTTKWNGKHWNGKHWNQGRGPLE